MKKHMWIVSLVFMLFIPLGAFLSFLSDPVTARLSLILFFFAPILIVAYYTLREPERRRTKALIALAFLVVPSLVFITVNITRFSIFLEGIQPSSTRLQAEQYRELGMMKFSGSHSYFFQTPLIMYAVSDVCGFSSVYASIVVFVLHIILIALVSLYSARVIMQNNVNHGLSFIPYLAVFSLFSSYNMMSTNVAYRYLGSNLLLLLLFFYYRRNCGERPRRAFSIIILMLTLGITFGDPTAAVLEIALFSLISILRRNISEAFYALIPLSYMLYAATAYVLMLKTYAIFSWEGFMRFFQQTLLGELPERVIPWQRAIMPTAQDAYVATSAYLSLLLLSAITGLSYVVLWIRKKTEADGIRRNPLMKANTLALLAMLAVGAITYAGVSTRPEAPISDIRTIVLIFSSVLLLFSFVSRTLLKGLTSKRVISAIVMILLIASSLRVIYNAYPKSAYDPINVVEDPRLDFKATIAIDQFISDFYAEGSIITDYKTRVSEPPSFQPGFYKIGLLGNSTLADPKSTFIIFNLNGLRYKSTYILPDSYSEAYSLMLTQNIIYSSGNITVIRRR